MMMMMILMMMMMSSFGNLNISISILGKIDEWKKVQKKDRKNINFEIINKKLYIYKKL